MKHVYSNYKKNHPDIQKEVVSMFDLGFLGVEKDFPTKQKSYSHIKRKKDQILTEVEEEYNKNHF